MRRLTNRQMEILSERVTDLLQEDHNIKSKTIKESEEYKRFNELYTSEVIRDLNNLLAKAKKIEQLIAELEAEAKMLEERNPDLYIGSLRYSRIGTLENSIEQQIKKARDAKYPDTYFNRDKTLRRVQADILLSDVENPEDLVKSLVEKLKDNED